MKQLRTLLVAAVIAMISAVSASAQFKWGLQAGIVANKLHFSEKTFESSNRVGFTGGATAEFKIPVIGIAVQGSLLYVHRTSEFDNGTDNAKHTYKRDYLTVPIHLKWGLGLPIVGRVVSPFIFTGPSFSYMVSKDKDVHGINSRKGDMAWDFGAGLTLVSHLQVKAGYSLGCTRAAQLVDGGFNRKIRNNYWTVTLGYLF